MSFGASPAMSTYPYGFGNGVSIRNTPIALSQPGQVFWVYNGTALPPTGKPGSDNNRGTFDAPFATIAGALTACVADRGDILMVKPGHAETITAITLLNLNVAGVAIVGLGNGPARPTLTVAGATAATLRISANNVTLRGFNIDLTGVDAIAEGITVDADGFSLLDCYVNTADAGGQCTIGISILAGHFDCTIAGCYILGYAGIGTAAAIQMVSGARHSILNNTIRGNYTAAVGAISNITTSTADLIIAGNFLANGTASSTKVINVGAGATGVIANNRMQILSGSTPITAAAMSWVGANYYANAVATAGTLI